jgi:arginase
MVEAARVIALPWPEAALVDEATLEAQTTAVVAALPVRPLILGGCCCCHVGAIRGLAERHGRIAVVWFDAHGDLNTPESSPSGNAWGMPLRMVLDAGDVAPADVALVGARELDPPEQEYLVANGIDADISRALEGTAGVYVAFDVDVLASGEIACFMPAAGGLSVAQAAEILEQIRSTGTPIVGLGFSAGLPECDPDTLVGLASALGV